MSMTKISRYHEKYHKADYLELHVRQKIYAPSLSRVTLAKITLEKENCLSITWMG